MFGKRAGEHAAPLRAGARRHAASTSAQVEAAWLARRWPRSTTAPAARTRTPSSTTCRRIMQDLVGIVRREAELQEASTGSRRLRRAGRPGRRRRQPRVQQRLAHGRRSPQPAHGLARRSRRAALERKESRGAHFRDDFPAKPEQFSTSTRDPQGRRRRDGAHARADSADAARADRGHRGEQVAMATATFRICGGARTARAQFQDYQTDVTEGMVVLDAVHAIQAEQAPDLACRWNCKAGKCGSCSAEINGKPKLMCMTRLNELPHRPARHDRADAHLPAHPRSGHRRLVELRGQEAHQAIQAAQAGRAGRHLADAAVGHRPRPGIP